MSGLVGFTKFITTIAPQRVLNKAASELFSKHSLLVTNVPATSVEVSFPEIGGQPIRSMSVCNANVMPQISIVSYNGFVYACIVADPELIPNGDALGKMWLEEFDILLAA